MLHHIKHTIKNNKTILSNIFSLGTLQIFSYILPLITLPYITRVIGPEKYGIVAFAGAFVAYFLIFVNYGFNLTATRDISINREDKNKISEIFWNIISIKLGLGIIATLVSLLLIYSFEIFSIHSTIFLFSLLAILGEILFPIWMFQGMERMKYITLINVIVRTLFLIPIFVVIGEAGDYIYLPLISSLSSITIGVIAFIMSVHVFQIRFHVPTRTSIVYHMKEGWHVFTSGIFISLYTVSTTFILGIFTHNIIVGYFAAAEKIIRVFQGLIGSISQAIYPSISQKLAVSRDDTIIFLQKVTLFIGGISLLTSLSIFLGSEFLIKLIYGDKYIYSIIILKILSPLIFIVGIGTITANLVMLNFGFKEQLSKVYLYISLISIPFSIPLTFYYSGIGMAIFVVFVELIIFIVLGRFLFNKGIYLINFTFYKFIINKITKFHL